MIGITSDSGNYSFLVLDRHYVGKIGVGQTVYAVCYTCLAGLPADDPHNFALIHFTPRVSLAARIVDTNPFGKNPPKLTFSFDVPYDPAFEQSSSTARVQGVYTTNLGTGYTLTIAIDATGQVTGNDTNGCNLAGNISSSHPAVDYYDVVLDVSACGNIDGRYNGNAALLFDNTGAATALFLSASNSKAAIGWQLDR